MVKPAETKDKPKSPPREKPKAITIKKIWRTRKRIVIKYNLGDDEIRLTCRDIPLPAFDDALDDLSTTVCTICAFPKEYAGKSMRVMGLDVGEKGGVDSVSLFAQRDVPDAAKCFEIHTPARLLRHPEAEGTYTPPLSNKDVERIQEAVEAAKDYVKGNRAQGQLSLAEDDDEEGEGPDKNDKTAALPFV